MVALGRQHLERAVGAVDLLAAAPAGQAAVDPPRIGEPAVVVQRHLAGLQRAVADGDAVAAAMEAGPAGIRDRLVDLDPEREVGLQELVGDVGERGPERVPVGAVSRRPAGNAAEADLVELVPLALTGIAGIHEVRAVGEAGRHHEVGRPLAEQAAEHVEDAPQRMGPGRERRGLQRLEQCSRRDPHVDMVVEAVVEHDLRIEHVDHVDADEHLEHFFVEEEVDRALGLRIGAVEIEDQHVAVAPHLAGHLVGAHAEPVVADVVLEIEGLVLADGVADQVQHGAPVALQQLVHRRDHGIDAEAVAELVDALLGEPDGGNQRVEVAPVPLRHAALVQDHLEDVFLQHVVLVDLDHRDDDAFLVDLVGIGRQAPRHLAADVGHVAEHRGVGDEPTVAIDRAQDQPVRRVADGAGAAVGIGGEEDVPLLDRAVILALEAVDEGAELADDHLAVGVGDHRELVVLLADSRRHGGAVEHGVHLVAGAAQRALDDVESDRIHLDRLEGRVVGLDDGDWHVAPPPTQWPTGLMMMLPYPSTTPTWPGRTSVVESISVTIAGPSILLPALSLTRS